MRKLRILLAAWLLKEPMVYDHKLIVGEDGDWTLRHPLADRWEGRSLAECLVHREVAKNSEAYSAGEYTISGG